MTDFNTLDVAWTKATKSSAQNACLEFADTAGQAIQDGVLLRDTKANGNGPVLLMGRSALGAMLAGAKNGELDRLL